MKDMQKHDDCEWANEWIVLYESSVESISLHRNIPRGEEFVILITNQSSEQSIENVTWCEMPDYHRLLPYRFKIQHYQKASDNFSLFDAFFGLSIEQFFGTISSALECV